MDEQSGSKEDGRQPASSVKENSGNKFLLIGIIVGVIVLNTVIAFFLIHATKPESAEEKHARIQEDSTKQAIERATAMGATIEKPIEAIVNIAGTDGERFLKTAIIFEYDDAAYPDLGAELARRAPKFKDLLINHLSRLMLSDLTEPDAKDKIRKDLLGMINAMIPPKIGEVREVLFTTYIIQ